MSCLEPQPIEKLMMKITIKAHLYSSARTKADSEQPKFQRPAPLAAKPLCYIKRRLEQDSRPT